MNNNNKYFVIFIGLGSLLLLGVIAENVITALKPKTAQIIIDVEKVKKEIEEAGIIPREAVYWKEIK